MPTNDERREIAAKLRELRVPLRFSPTCSLSEIIHGRDGCASYDSCDKCEADVLRALADLIEPEERTCRMKLSDCTDSLGQKMYRCSECGALMTDDACFFEGEPDIDGFSYCPNCGAKVVDEDA